MTKETQDWWALLEQNLPKIRDIVIRFNENRVVFFDSAIMDKNTRHVGEILQHTWELAPDKPWIHTIPSWGVLCDLCSDYVFGDLEL